MACVIGPTDKGMAKFDKGNWNKVYQLWGQRIETENHVNISTDRRFSVSSKPRLMAEKVNNVDPRDYADDETGADFPAPPHTEVNDVKFLGIEAYPRDRFVWPQTCYQEHGWMNTPGYESKENIRKSASAFALKTLQEKDTTTGNQTGLWNMRDEYFKTEKRRGKRNPMAHHIGFVTNLADNPYADISKKEKKKAKEKRKKEREERRKARAASVGAIEGSQADTASVLSADTFASTAIGSKVSLLAPTNSSMVQLANSNHVIEQKIAKTNDEIIERYKRFQGININKKAMERRWNHPLGQTDVTKFADAYTKSMTSGLFAKNQLLVSR